MIEMIDKTPADHCAGHKEVGGNPCGSCICPELLAIQRRAVRQAKIHYAEHGDNCTPFECVTKQILISLELNEDKP